MHWRILGRGPGGRRPPLFLTKTEARRAKKKFLETGFPPPPLARGLNDRPPPPPYLNVWIRHCYGWRFRYNKKTSKGTLDVSTPKYTWLLTTRTFSIQGLLHSGVVTSKASKASYV